MKQPCPDCGGPLIMTMVDANHCGISMNFCEKSRKTYAFSNKDGRRVPESDLMAPVEKPSSITPKDLVSKYVADVMNGIMAQREEILRAFVAKYGCQPEEAVQVVTESHTGTQWRVEHKSGHPVMGDKSFVSGISDNIGPAVKWTAIPGRSGMEIFSTGPPAIAGNVAHGQSIVFAVDVGAEDADPVPEVARPTFEDQVEGGASADCPPETWRDRQKRDPIF